MEREVVWSHLAVRIEFPVCPLQLPQIRNIMPLYQVSPAQYGGFLTYFNRNATDGFMGRNEIRAALARCGIQATDVEAMEIIDAVSVDGRGISWQAFVDFVSSFTAFRDVENEYAEAFRIYDRSGTGTLSREDITYVMNKLGVKVDLDSLFNEVDVNRDGVIEYDEFVGMMKKTFI